jgi:hypothetical protein
MVANRRAPIVWTVARVRAMLSVVPRRVPSAAVLRHLSADPVAPVVAAALQQQQRLGHGDAPRGRPPPTGRGVVHARDEVLRPGGQRVALVRQGVAVAAHAGPWTGWPFRAFR